MFWICQAPTLPEGLTPLRSEFALSFGEYPNAPASFWASRLTLVADICNTIFPLVTFFFTSLGHIFATDSPLALRDLIIPFLISSILHRVRISSVDTSSVLSFLHFFRLRTCALPLSRIPSPPSFRSPLLSSVTTNTEMTSLRPLKSAFLFFLFFFIILLSCGYLLFV